MNKHETIFILIIGALFFIGWLITCHLYSLERDKNIEGQKENTMLIDKNLKLQKEVSLSNKEWINVNNKYNNALDIIAKKKELLEIQDKLLDENNIKH
jgi:hypothetical protein